MDKAHAVQALSWQATALAIGDKPCCGKHAFHWHWPLKMPKLTDVDGRACTELGTGRDCHYAAKTGAHRHMQGYFAKS